MWNVVKTKIGFDVRAIIIYYMGDSKNNAQTRNRTRDSTMGTLNFTTKLFALA